jgi:phospholipid transport system substrate-binding protein
MHLRRFVLGAMTALPMLSLSQFAMSPYALAQAVPPDAAKAFIQTSGQQLVGVVNGNASTDAKAQQLQTLINQMVAVDNVGDYVLGHYKNVATPDQHAQFLALFHQLLSYNITYQIKAYQGITFVVNGSSMQGNDTVVDTTITRPGQAPADVGWAVDEIGGTPKIVDVIVAGTSLRITTRNDYASVVTNNGGQISALLAAMQNQINRIKSNQ